MKKINLDWELGYSKTKNESPYQWFAATVPGSVQLDYAKAKNLPDYNKDSNYQLYDGLEDFYWTYKTIIPSGQNRFLISHGIDYQYDIYFNNQLIYSYTGMYHGFKLRIPGKNEGLLKIVIYPAPKHPREVGRSQARSAFKPAVNYGWDFQQRLIPLGIWNDCYLVVVDKHTIINQNLSYDLSSDLKTCVVTLDYEITGGEIVWELDNQVISSKKLTDKLVIVVQNPELWYPIHYGNQFLYNSKVSLKNTNEIYNKKIGFRKARLIPKAKNWEPESYEGLTQAKPGITLEINGIEVFAKGSNYVVPDIFYSKMNKEIYAHYINLAKESNFNVLRHWGGCMVNKDSFYELCDEAGIMVIQEFPLSCNDYVDTNEYLTVLKNESISIVMNLRKHPSVVVYSGGNELFQNWSMMTEQSKALRNLNSICLEHDANTPFVMTLPIYGVIHGSYGFLYRNMEPQILFRQLQATAFTEFGVPSTSSKETFDVYMSNPEKYKVEHFGKSAWPGNIESWSNETQIESFLGKIKDLDDLIFKSQLLQGIIYKQIFEEVRWQKETASMAINWNFNDSYPTYANNSLVEYGGKPKPALKEIGNSLKPTVLSLITDSVKVNDIFTAKLGILNDAKETSDVNVEIVFIQGEKKIIKHAKLDKCNPYKNSETIDLVIDLYAFNKGLFKVILRGNDYDNEYNFIKS